MDHLSKLNQAKNCIIQEFKTVESSLGLILGTGLGDWIEDLKLLDTIPYTQIPNFPCSTVQTHAGELCLMEYAGRKVLILRGRVHLYEGYSPQEVVFGIRLLGMLGIKRLILTNAAGALNPLFNPGQLMVISDHINMTGHNPLRGPNLDPLGERFPDLSQVYARNLQQLALQTGLDLRIVMQHGVYLAVQGPSLETPAETRAFRLLGADAVGMSTVMEAIAARHMGIEVLGLSCLTNKNLPDCMTETSFAEVVQQAKQAAPLLGKVIKGLLSEL